jgi:hypothetical protein
MDHGQEALRGFAKILLVLPKLQKEKDDLSYRCPMAIREGKSPDDKKLAFCTKFFANFHFFAYFSRAHAGTLQNHSIPPRASTVLNTTVESSTIFYSNLMLRINLVYEI